jgi:hypothetical protein
LHRNHDAVVVQSFGLSRPQSLLLRTQSKDVRVRTLALESEGVRADDLLDITVTTGSLVEAIAGVATPPDQPPAFLSTV